jgi:hypothetical protein
MVSKARDEQMPRTVGVYFQRQGRLFMRTWGNLWHGLPLARRSLVRRRQPVKLKYIGKMPMPRKFSATKMSYESAIQGHRFARPNIREGRPCVVPLIFRDETSSSLQKTSELARNCSRQLTAKRFWAQYRRYGRA